MELLLPARPGNEIAGLFGENLLKQIGIPAPIAPADAPYGRARFARARCTRFHAVVPLNPKRCAICSKVQS